MLPNVPQSYILPHQLIMNIQLGPIGPYNVLCEWKMFTRKLDGTVLFTDVKHLPTIWQGTILAL